MYRSKARSGAGVLWWAKLKSCSGHVLGLPRAAAPQPGAQIRPWLLTLLLNLVSSIRSRAYCYSHQLILLRYEFFSLLSPCSLLETTSFGLFFCLFEIKHGDECVCNVFRSTCYSLIVLHMVTPCSEPMHVSTEEMIITSAFFCKENEDEEDCIIVSCL